MPIDQKKNHCKTGNWFGKPYYFFGDYLRHKYGVRVLKLPIDAGFTCPNRDSRISSEGCIFCPEDGSASPTTSDNFDIHDQMESARMSFKRSDANTKYIAYFQAFSNTYGSGNNLREKYQKAVSYRDVVGLMIATRPDCLSDEILKIISNFKKKNFELSLEIGMQTMHNNSLKFLNRGHTHEKTREAVIKTAEYGIHVCVHVILGIPNETWDDMMKTALEISSLPINGIKIHHLHIIKNTKLEEYYKKKLIRVLKFKEYISLLCDFLERIRPDIVIHRLIGDRNERTLIAPKWAAHKGTVLKAVEDEFHSRCAYQGFLYNEFETGSFIANKQD